MKWNDVKVSQFLELRKIINIEDETDRVLSLAELFFGEDISSLPVSEFNKKVKELDFLKTDIPNDHIVNIVQINGNKYSIDALVGHISTAQYIDFTNYLKEEPENNIHKALSVFFIPKGHKYNDGYDMSVVQKDMLDLPIDIATSECFFFNRQLDKFIEIFQASLRKQIKKKKLPKEIQERLLSLTEHSLSLASYPTSLSSVK